LDHLDSAKVDVAFWLWRAWQASNQQLQAGGLIVDDEDLFLGDVR
jgi:hypothetical protein